MPNTMPGIFAYMDGDNPTISSPYTPYEIQFKQTPDSLLNAEDYRAFIKNAERAFRNTREYKLIKSDLLSMGMNRCQVLGNIINDGNEIKMASLEMHHNILTLFDICLIITEHLTSIGKGVTTYDLVDILIEEHYNHNVALVMLSKTPHQLYHDNSQFFIPLSMCYGDPWTFISKYRFGITQDIAYKLLYYIRLEEQNNGKCNDNHLLDLREDILKWSGLG